MKRRVDNLAIARAVKKARQEEREKAREATATQATAGPTRTREAVVVYKNGETEMQLATPLRFVAAQDAVEFAALLGAMFPLYQFYVAPALGV